MKSFYENEPGYCLSATINKYVYVFVNLTPFHGIRSMYDETQDVKSLDDLKNVLIRECLRHYNIQNEVTVASVSDIPVHGSGLGASSAFTVGLVHALEGKKISKISLAEIAVDIEINHCKHPIGKQDQYATAIGGANLWTFLRHGNVERYTSDRLWNNVHELANNLLLVYSGIPRQANDILKAQNKAIETDKSKFELLKKNAIRATVAKDLIELGHFDDFGNLLHEAWMDKKAIVAGISNDEIDRIYNHARSSGALGGKLIGAGGGGFFLFYVPIQHRQYLVNELKDYKIYDFKFVESGSEVTEI